MNPAVAVGGGAVAGALLRWKITSVCAQNNINTVIAVMSINTAGSFALGSLASSNASPNSLLFFGTGFCGSFTTFSTFSVDVVKLLESGFMTR
jgi:CrcB protein